MVAQLDYLYIHENLTINDNFVYLEGNKEPIGFFDEYDTYCSLEPEPPEPQYDDMLVPYPIM